MGNGFLLCAVQLQDGKDVSKGSIQFLWCSIALWTVFCNNGSVYEVGRRFIYKKQGRCGVTSIVLVCAVLASLAAGVLVAYGVCYAMFALFRIHARQVAVRSASQVVAVRTVEG